jgi:uncharacterized protein (DUF2461 family)
MIPVFLLFFIPANVKILAVAKKYNQVHWFVENKDQLEKDLNTVLPLVKDDITCWISNETTKAKVCLSGPANVY